jgi:hypothetical protein
MTVASTNPAKTRSALARSYPNALCVVPSAYAWDEVAHAATVARWMVTPETTGQPPDWVTGVEVRLRPDGQPQVQVNVAFDNPAVRKGLASLPAGLAVVVPWLQPVRSG